MSEDLEREKKNKIKEAWDRWLYEDFTWEGLKNRPWKDDKSLQDYWRWHLATDVYRDDATLEADKELVVVVGQPTYHIAHLPDFYPDRSPTLKTINRKAVQRHLESLFHERIKKSGENVAQPALLQGAFFTKIDLSASIININISANFNNCCFLENANFHGSNIYNSNSFKYTHFFHDADFEHATFINKNSFDDVIFVGSTYFNNTKFQDDVSFKNTFFDGKVEFSNVDFEGFTDYERTTFRSYAAFHNASFNGPVRFADTNFVGESSFVRVSFNNEVFFGLNTFQRQSDFWKASFKLEALFQSCAFNNLVNFEDVNFSGKADFIDIDFNGLMNFKSARFEQIARFQVKDWPSASANHHQAFEKALFQNFVDFSGSKFRAFAAFYDARFEKGMRFDRPENDIAAENQFYKELAAAKNSNGREASLAELEAGCRVLRLEMAKQGDRHREHLLNKFELMTRREQAGTRRLEKLALAIYSAVSNYGSDLLRPVKVWAWIITVSGLTYAFFKSSFYTPVSEMTASSREGRLAIIMDAYGYAFNRALPLSFWPDKSAFVDEKHAYSFWHFAFNCLSMGESVASAVLIFLFFLALRRRFQIN